MRMHDVTFINLEGVDGKFSGMISLDAVTDCFCHRRVVAQHCINDDSLCQRRRQNAIPTELIPLNRLEKNF